MTPRDVAGARVVVAGIGVSGRAVARVLRERGAQVVVVDAADGARQRDAAGALAAAVDVDVRLRATEDDIVGDLVVASPGWRLDQPLLVAARDRDIEVIGEVELAWQLRSTTAPWIGVTGTNGKTTTVGMVEAIFRASGLHAVAAGNVGLPLVEAVTAEPPYDVLAVEMSSQQLAWSEAVRFAAAAILNIADDHLDWHDTVERYAEAKTAIWRDATAIANIDDKRVRALMPSDAVTFSIEDRTASYAVVDGALVENARAGRVVAIHELQVHGPHNIANALAATALVRRAGVGVDLDAAGEGLRGFAPGRHRNETVVDIGGVRYVDDSKATNPHAAAASLGAYESVVWIAGGLLKGADVTPLVAAHRHRLRGVVLLGRDRGLVADALARHAPDVPVVEVDATDTDAMNVVVRDAAALARPGDVVLLAPAGASWDMFADYADRGDRFAAAARALGGPA